MELAHTSDRRRERYRSCGSHAWLMYHPTEQTARIVSNRCWDSLCPRCSRIRQLRLVERLQPVLKQGTNVPRLRHITLTLRSLDAPIREQVARLRLAFRRLRQTRLWKDRVRGGFAAVEVTHNRGSGQWHPHLHVIAEGRYIPHSALSAAWLRATGDSYVVHLTRVPARGDRIAQYVAKYAGKGCDPLKIGSGPLAEWLADGARGRLWTTFGSWHGSLPPYTRDADAWDGWCRIDDLADLVAAARDGDPDAAWLIRLAGAEDLVADAPAPPPDWRPWPPRVVLGPSAWSLTPPEHDSHYVRNPPPSHAGMTDPVAPAGN